MKKISLIMMISVLLIITACGSTATVNKPIEPTTSSEPTGSTAENTLEQIKKRGKFIIGTTGTFRPMTFMNEKGELDGVDIEIAKTIAEKMGVEAEFVTGNLAGLIPGLNADKYDVVMFSTTMNEDRKQVIDFSEKYASLGTIAVVRENDDRVKDVTDLDGFVVGVIGGSGSQTAAMEIGGYKELKEYPGHAEAISDLKSERIDVYVAGSIAAYDFIQNDTGDKKLKVVGELYKELDIGVGIRKNDAELKAFIDSVILEMKEGGRLGMLLDKWIKE
ncbi:transporter substrate-binding domain-containing protein [Cohnella sp.]|uniref:transporter substrate-binding domain-containing protein n=1 Tax=Cohnella sp. TaxID=1883426 RepID=UPI0035647640